MWYKVQELKQSGLNKSQIKIETGLDRATIRKYQNMDEETFHSWIKQKRNLPRKLSNYRNYVKEMLIKFPYLSSAQVEDRLKENYKDLPEIHSKTVFNFVQSIREEFNIPKPSVPESRWFEKLPEPPFGKQAQVDFGETWMQNKNKKRQKVYFFAVVLCRSRYKYLHLKDQPFSSETAIKAHFEAFEYFAGIPKEIIYDQDSVFIHNENLGDYLLTQKFSAFSKSQQFKPIFCRKADPQSKGKIENVVKYIKQNFLRGREYINIEILNQEALSWLERTANKKIHSSTKLIPKQEWEHEKSALQPLKPKYNEKEFIKYKVRKDNTFCFRSNYYSVPLGTYQDKESSILLEISPQELHIYTLEKQFICSHILSSGRGQTIRNTDHRREKSKTLEVYQQKVLELFYKTELAENYLEVLGKKRSRYFRDILQYILKHHKNYQADIVRKGLAFCIEHKIYNAKDLISVLNKLGKENDHPPREASNLSKISGMIYSDQYDDVEKTDINIYEDIIK